MAESFLQWLMRMGPGGGVNDAVMPYVDQAVEKVRPFVPPELRGKVKGAGEVANVLNPATSLQDLVKATEAGNVPEALLAGLGAVPGDPLWPLAKAVFLGPLGLARISGKPVQEMLELERAVASRSSDPTIGRPIITRENIEDWQKARLFSGVDRKLRAELPDDTAKLVPVGPAQPGNLSNIQEFQFQHPYHNLHEIYDIPNIKVGLDRPPSVSPNVGGVHFPGTREIEIYTTPEAAVKDLAMRGHYTPKSTAGHEIQHGIQRMEGFETGAYPPNASFTRPFWEELGKPVPKQAEMMEASEELTKLWQSGDKNPLLEAAQRIYRRAMGETEARNVQYRMANPSIYSLHPLTTMDVPTSMQVPFNEMFLTNRYGTVQK